MKLDKGVIEPTISEWAPPVILTSKPSGKWRFRVDYRKLNEMTKREVYPLSRLEYCIDTRSHAERLSTFDAKCGYWQAEMDRCDKPKTTFTTHCGTFQHERMPFGPKNAPATFQRALDMILVGFRWEPCLVYIDYVIVFSDLFDQHLIDEQNVLKAFIEANVTLNPSKCTFFSQTVDYLGHRVTPDKLAVAVKNTDPLKRCPYSTTQTDPRSFPGLYNVYRRFVPSFARVAAPLNTLLKRDVK